MVQAGLGGGSVASHGSSEAPAVGLSGVADELAAVEDSAHGAGAVAPAGVIEPPRGVDGIHHDARAVLDQRGGDDAIGLELFMLTQT